MELAPDASIVTMFQKYSEYSELDVEVCSKSIVKYSELDVGCENCQ